METRTTNPWFFQWIVTIYFSFWHLSKILFLSHFLAGRSFLIGPNCLCLLKISIKNNKMSFNSGLCKPLTAWFIEFEISIRNNQWLYPHSTSALRLRLMWRSFLESTNDFKWLEASGDNKDSLIGSCVHLGAHVMTAMNLIFCWIVPPAAPLGVVQMALPR